MLDHEQDLFMCRTYQVPRGGGGVTHHLLQISDVVPGDFRGWADEDGGQHDFQVALHKPPHGKVIIFLPVSGPGKPDLLVGPLGGEKGVVSRLLI